MPKNDGTLSPAAQATGQGQPPAIVISGARTHNLKNIRAVIPHFSLTVITGPSGSGKSSLAFDTLYAEGQRRYVESLSVYARQFLDQLSKPEVDEITGLSPAIAIQQQTTSYNPRSTVGTVTEIYDYLRLLFARIAEAYCFRCQEKIQSQSPQQMADQILALSAGTRVALLAPIVRDRKGEHQKELATLRQKGFVRVRVDGETLDLSDPISLDKNRRHSIEVFVDRFTLQAAELHPLQTRVLQSVSLTLKMGSGLLLLTTQAPAAREKSERLFSERFACSQCSVSYPEPEPRTFSFNSPQGACPSCQGLGETPRPADLPASAHFQAERCSACQGMRLKSSSLHFLIAEKNIAQICELSIQDLQSFLLQLQLSARSQKIAERILKEIGERLHFLTAVGVGYLSLARSAQSLSGGESQRIRLATQIGSSLVGVIYVLDEPSIGLHQKDHQKLITALIQLKELGNTVVVVEHDRETMEAADWILDLGPGAGRLGGELMAMGTLPELLKHPDSLTGRYLSGALTLPVPAKRRKANFKHCLTIHHAAENNLKNLTVQIPLGLLVGITGVSGSGKSTLIMDTLYPLLAASLLGSKLNRPLKVKEISGIEAVDKVIDIDQSSIGRTPRSNPATFTGIFTLIRELFAQLPDSQIRGFTPGRYSFNVKGGRCEACEGDGVKKIEMHFLPDVFVTCEVCQGQRFHRDTLEIRYKGKNIAEILQMSCEEAYPFFDAIPMIKVKLKILLDVGLGYLSLGQSSATLSGGEAQRLKLAKELARRSTGKTVYILDEPSTGLHFEDIKKLIAILQLLVTQGNTVIIIEHNLDIIKVADYLIDMGPTGGSQGGYVLAAGTPEEIVAVKKSDTGRFLKRYLTDL